MLCLPCLFLSGGFSAYSVLPRRLSPFQFLSGGLLLSLLILPCPLFLQCLVTQTVLPGKLVAFAFQPRCLAPGRLISAGGVLPQLLLPGRFPLCSRYLFRLSRSFCADLLTLQLGRLLMRESLCILVDLLRRRILRSAG